MFEQIPTPTILLDAARMESNISAMQQVCDSHSTELRPHIKTHKMVEVARRQLEAGAAGLTCAKLSEVEAMLPSGVRSVFVAHSLVDSLQIPRLQRLHEQLDELIVACTSEAHLPYLEALLVKAGLTLPVMMAVDTGLGREGARGLESAVKLAQLVMGQPHLKLHGFYTHEGQLYGASPDAAPNDIADVHERLLGVREAIAPDAGDLKVWPGCSVSARRMAALPGVDAVRPGAYLFGDLFLSEVTGVMEPEQVALTVLATVVDKPAPGLALIDAGSKVFSSDRTAEGVSARPYSGDNFQVTRCNEEHGYLTGEGVDTLRIGSRVRLVPAHVCTVVNLTDKVTVVRGADVVDSWKVDARGCVQ